MRWRLWTRSPWTEASPAPPLTRRSPPQEPAAGRLPGNLWLASLSGTWHRRDGRRLLALAGSPLRPEWSAWLEYYARLPARLELDAHAVQLNPRTLSDRRNYALDLARPLCRVDLMARFCCRFGDPTEPPEQPTLDSARRFDEVSGDPVPMKLDRVRYFVRARDPLGSRSFARHGPSCCSGMPTPNWNTFQSARIACVTSRESLEASCAGACSRSLSVGGAIVASANRSVRVQGLDRALERESLPVTLLAASCSAQLPLDRGPRWRSTVLARAAAGASPAARGILGSRR